MKKINDKLLTKFELEKFILVLRCNYIFFTQKRGLIHEGK